MVTAAANSKEMIYISPRRDPSTLGEISPLWPPKNKVVEGDISPPDGHPVIKVHAGISLVERVRRLSVVAIKDVFTWTSSSGLGRLPCMWCMR